MYANEDMLIAHAESKTMHKSKEQRQRAYEEEERNDRGVIKYTVGA